MPQHEQQDAILPSRKHALRNRILVIDDGDWVRNIIGLFLEHAGFEVCGEAADGVEAIEHAKKLKPDLIVLDLVMPRMNGAEAASILSQTKTSCWALLAFVGARFGHGRVTQSSRNASRICHRRSHEPVDDAHVDAQTGGTADLRGTDFTV